MPNIRLTECTRIALGFPKASRLEGGGCTVNVSRTHLAALEGSRRPGWRLDDAFFAAAIQGGIPTPKTGA